MKKLSSLLYLGLAHQSTKFKNVIYAHRFYCSSDLPYSSPSNHQGMFLVPSLSHRTLYFFQFGPKVNTFNLHFNIIKQLIFLNKIFSSSFLLCLEIWNKILFENFKIQEFISFLCTFILVKNRNFFMKLLRNYTARIIDLFCFKKNFDALSCYCSVFLV